MASIKKHGTIKEIKISKEELERFLYTSLPKLLSFFDVRQKNIGKLSIKITTDPITLAQYYTGDINKKEWSEKELKEIYEDVQCFFDDETNNIFLIDFYRSGENKYSNNNPVYIPAQNIIHEIIHWLQFNYNGYSTSYFFDESVVELLSYVLCGGIDPSNMHDYFEDVKYLCILILNSKKSATTIDMLAWCKDYILSKDKSQYILDLLQHFVKNNSIDISPEALLYIIEQCFQKSNYNKLQKIQLFRSLNAATVQDLLYELFEKYSIIK